MARFSQATFLNGPPQPLILTMDRRNESPLDLYVKIASPSQPSFLLESGTSLSGEPHYSFLGCSPIATVANDISAMHGPTKDPFAALRQAITGPRIERTQALPPFFGGAVGYFSYDFVRHFETLPSMALKDLPIPDLHFALFDLVAAIDHETNRVQLLYCPPMERFLGEPRDKLYREGIDRLAEWESRLTSATAPEQTLRAIDPLLFTPQQTKDEYLYRVNRCQQYIAAGDIYQANLSHRFGMQVPEQYRTGTERLRYEQALYRQIRKVNPSPFSGILHFDDLSLISSSPERLVRLEGRRADTRPIAGTRPRGFSEADD
ncbi:chorismate-binding protein, partial [Petrachloros mirabilis]